MIWKEKGVKKGSYMCFFRPSDIFREIYCYMVSCGYFLCDGEYSVKKSETRPPIFFYIVDGSLQVEYEKKKFIARANDVVLLNCRRPHHYYCTDQCEFLFFHFDGAGMPAMVDRLTELNGGPVFTPPNARDIYDNISGPIMKLCYQEEATDAFLSSVVYSTLCMIPKGGAVSKRFIPSRRELPADTVSRRVIEYIDQHVDRNFTLQELADYVNLSRHYFARLFKKETGYSPLEYVSIAKINCAKMILRTTSLTVAEIADDLGYSSSASFINAFRARRGISPNRYRSLNAKRQER